MSLAELLNEESPNQANHRVPEGLGDLCQQLSERRDLLPYSL